MNDKSLNKVLFLVDIVSIYDEFVYDEYYVSALTEFVLEYYIDYKDCFDLVFETSSNDVGWNVNLFSDYQEYMEVVNYISSLNSGLNFKKIFDNVSVEDVSKISELAIMFVQFLNGYNLVLDDVYTKIKQ